MDTAGSVVEMDSLQRVPGPQWVCVCATTSSLTTVGVCVCYNEFLDHSVCVCVCDNEFLDRSGCVCVCVCVCVLQRIPGPQWVRLGAKVSNGEILIRSAVLIDTMSPNDFTALTRHPISVNEGGGLPLCALITETAPVVSSPAQSSSRGILPRTELFSWYHPPAQSCSRGILSRIELVL